MPTKGCWQKKIVGLEIKLSFLKTAAINVVIAYDHNAYDNNDSVTLAVGDEVEELRKYI